MASKCTLLAATVITVLSVSVAPVLAVDCSKLPTQFTGNEFPSGNFFSNFNNSCYAVSFAKGRGGGNGQGDLNSMYYKLYYKVDPRYQLVVTGAFPQARYFSVALYDEHAASARSILDVNVAPLNSHYTNPFQPGAAYTAGQRYAVPIDFGGSPGTVQAGCSTKGFNVDGNKLDATQRHQGMDWNNDPGFFQMYPNAPLHQVDTAQHTNPNKSGTIFVRSYLDVANADIKTVPYVIVRDVASGCALPADYALNTLQIVTNKSSTGDAWLDTTQGNAHQGYDYNYLPQLCYATDPQNQLVWRRSHEYSYYPNPYSSYAVATAPAGLTGNLATAGEVMRISLRVPVTPPTPCTNGCSRSGLEELRYMSLSFGTPNVTLASLADSAFTKDANGYATLIVSTGTPIPQWATPANGYTVLNLASVAGYDQLSQLTVRNIIPAPDFSCPADGVPFRTVEHTPDGGLMGQYLPVVDFPPAAGLPQVAAPLVHPNACGVFPAGQPGIWPTCEVF
jgi:hypothetical protein